MFDPGPCVYMEKLVGGPEIASSLTLTEPIGTVVERVAADRGVSPTEITTVILDRERHADGVAQIREAGGRIRFITDGDVSAALLAVMEGTGVDLLWGIGGTPEGVISAAAIKCLGGQILGRLWPRNDDERQAAIDGGYDLDRILEVDDLVGGEDAFFAASGVTDGDLLQGVRYHGASHATTESLVMRSRSSTVRRIGGRHDATKLREVTGGLFG
jgi:fructose-1,6-bisphosphatase II